MQHTHKLAGWLALHLQLFALLAGEYHVTPAFLRLQKVRIETTEVLVPIPKIAYRHRYLIYSLNAFSQISTKSNLMPSCPNKTNSIIHTEITYTN